MANALEAASLVMIPSGYEDGTLGSLKPTDGTGDFTFSRGSDISATRVNEDGYIEKGYENLFLQSNTFSDAAWDKFNLLQPVNGYEGYDGSNDAWKLVANSGTDSRIRQSFSTTGIITTSFYAKAAEWNYVGIYVFGSNKGVVWSLIDGSVQNPIISYPEIYSNGEDVGNGWWKFSMTHNVVSGDVRIWACEQNIYNGNTPDGVSGIYIQDAMLNQGLVAYPYVETTTAPVAGGILEDMPRLDYSGSCPALLLEPQRTNLIDYSEAIEFGITSNECTQTITNQTNPSGNDVSYLASAINDNNDQFRYDRNGLSSGSYFLSAFVKGDGNANRIRLRGTGGGVSVGNVYWNVAADGTITFDSPSGINAITESYGNGWYRIGYEETYDGTGRFLIYPSNGDVNASTYAWGIQWEAGTYPTSYIPTYGTSQTRLRDTQNELTIPNGNVSEGTIFYEFDKAQAPNSFDITPFKIGSNRMLRISQYNPNMRFAINENAINYNETNSYNAHIKVAVSYSGSSVKLFINGNLRATDNTYSGSGNVIVPASGLQSTLLGCSIESQQLIYFPTALSDDECIELTTI